MGHAIYLHRHGKDFIFDGCLITLKDKNKLPTLLSLNVNDLKKVCLNSAPAKPKVIQLL